MINLEDKDFIPKELKLNQSYTTTWAANKNATWVLINVLGYNKCYLKTKSTGLEFETSTDSLRYTRKQAMKNKISELYAK